MKKGLKNTDKGITLIALVITIVVLLILVGVTISTLTGDNGILTKAQSSKVATDKGALKEKLTLYLNEYRLEKEDTNQKDTLKPVVEWMLDKNYIQSKEEYYVFFGESKAKTDGNICVIEKETTESASTKEQQKVATTLTSDVERSLKIAEETPVTEQKYVLNYYKEVNGKAETLMRFSANGIILAVASMPEEPTTPEDNLPEVTDWVRALPSGYTKENANETDLQKGVWFTDDNGNEWTWVVVPRNEAFKSDKAEYINENEYNYTKIFEDLASYSYKCIHGATLGYISRSNYDYYFSGCGLSKEEYDSRYNQMLASVYENGGFWISRYEIGKEDYNRIAVSQKNMKPYNNVTLAESENLAEGLSVGNKNSSLIFGIQDSLIASYLFNSDYGKSFRDEIQKKGLYKIGNFLNAQFDFDSDDVKLYSKTYDVWKAPGEFMYTEWVTSESGAPEEDYIYAPLSKTYR